MAQGTNSGVTVADKLNLLDFVRIKKIGSVSDIYVRAKTFVSYVLALSKQTHVAITYESTPYTVDGYDKFISCDASLGAITVNIPTAVGFAGSKIAIHKQDTSANAIVVDAAGAETINGHTTLTISRKNSTAVLESNGSNWYIT